MFLWTDAGFDGLDEVAVVQSWIRPTFCLRHALDRSFPALISRTYRGVVLQGNRESFPERASGELRGL